MTPAEAKLRELVSDVDDAHSAVVRNDRTLQQATRIAEESQREFDNALRMLQEYAAMASPSGETKEFADMGDDLPGAMKRR